MAKNTVVNVQQGSVTATIAKMGRSKIAVRDAGVEAVKAAGRVQLRHTLIALSQRDHSLADLARLGHPYARRHGSIRVHANRPWLVHSQSGQLLRSVRSGVQHTRKGPSYRIRFDTNVARHAIFVTQGTRVMLPRDPLWNVAVDPIVQREQMRAIVGRLGRELRSKVGMRFGSAAVRGTSSGRRGRGLMSVR